MMFKYRLNFSLLFFLLVFLVQKSGAQNIDLLFPVVDAFSKDLPSYVHLKDGNKFEGRLINFVKENNIIKEIKLELKNEEVGIFKAENISHAYLPIGAKNTKTLNTSKTLLLQQVEKISLDHGKLLKGYAYLLSTQVVSKKGKTEHSVLQVLNPFHCQNIKIMNNPNAKRPPDPFAGLGEATSVYIKKGDEPVLPEEKNPCQLEKFK